MALRILIVSDNKPGHLNQSLGLVQSLKEVCEVEVEIIDISYRVKFLRSLLNRLVNSAQLLGRFINHILVKYSQDITTEPDVVISCGGYTCASNILFTRRFTSKNIFLGTPKGFDLSSFSLVISTSSIGEASNNLVVDVMPQRFDEIAVKKAVSEFLEEKSLSDNQQYWLLLIGGSTSYYEYSQSDWEKLALMINKLALKYSIKWLISTSRRTPEDVEKYFMSTFKVNPNTAYSVFYNQQPDKCLPALFGLSSVIFCTEDSTSMLSEAVITGAQVVSLSGNTVGQPAQGHIELVQKLARKGHIERLTFDNVLLAFKPEQPRVVRNQAAFAEKVLELLI